MGVLVIQTSTFAEEVIPRYRITMLGVPVNGYESKAYGINDHGHVVGEYDFVYDDQGDDLTLRRAFVWLSEPALGFDRDGVHDLGVIMPEPPVFYEGESVAQDISNDGRIVGWSDLDSEYDIIHGFIWMPYAIPPLDKGMNDLGSLGIDQFSLSEAWGINSGYPLEFVGETHTDVNCGSFDRVRIGIQWDSSLGMTILGLPQELEDFETTNAQDMVWVDTVPSVRLIGGYASHCGSQDTALTSPVAWHDGDAIAVSTFLPEEEGSVQGVDKSGGMTGWVWKTSALERRAVYWPDAYANPVDLGDDDWDYSMAEEIRSYNDGNNIQIVGYRGDQSRRYAVLWEYDQVWSHFDLEAKSHGCHDLDLREAYSINDNGWIVGFGYSQPASENSAFLLTPVGDCFADITGDGEVNTDDVFAILGQFGTCQVQVICSGDVNFDCTVNIDDVFVILGLWGPCDERYTGGTGLDFQGWLDRGGREALELQLITIDDVNQCYEQRTNTGIQSCLDSLLE